MYVVWASDEYALRMSVWQVLESDFAGLFNSGMTDEQLRAAFDEIDTDQSGLLDRHLTQRISA